MVIKQGTEEQSRMFKTNKKAVKSISKDFSFESNMVIHILIRRGKK